MGNVVVWVDPLRAFCVRVFERLDIPPYRFFPLVDAAISGGFLGWGNDTGKKAELLRRIKAALERL